MKTGKVAKSFGIDPKTVLNWTDHPLFRKFFTHEALGDADHTQRDFNESDLMVLNTIRSERARNTDWEDIAKILEGGYREDELPPTAMLVETTAPIAQYGRIVALTAERDSALAEVNRLKEEAKQKDTVLEQLQREIQKLNREIGKLEGKMEYLKERQDENE